MRNVSLIEFDMESHYKDSLSTAIVNILLQCGFENSSKRALDELIGMSLNYMKNITSKISNLTNDCNLKESDILIGLGALKMHGHNLDELFDFVQNYNDIFPPPPKTFFGPIPIQTIESKRVEEKPLEIVSWAPEMAPSLATIGMKLKNRQIVSDPNFDHSSYLALSLSSSPPSSKHPDHKSQAKCTKTSSTLSKIPKYGSNCSYELPPEAYPIKYEPPTIDLDSNGAVIGLNGKIGKLPDPFINDSEERDILRQKSKFLELHQHQAKLNSFTNHQLFNGVRHQQQQQQQQQHRLSTTGWAHDECVGGSRMSSLMMMMMEASSRDEMKENILAGSPDPLVSSSSIDIHGNSSSCNNAGHGSATNLNSMSSATIANSSSSAAAVAATTSSTNHHHHHHYLHGSSSAVGTAQDRNAISDDVWNAALQAKVEPLMKSDNLMMLGASSHGGSLHAGASVGVGAGSGAVTAVSSVITTNSHHHQHERGGDDRLARGDTQHESHSGSSARRKAKKHKRTSSHSSSRPSKKSRKLADRTEDERAPVSANSGGVVGAASFYQNESTMDSYVSERSVPYSTDSEREPLYNHHRHRMHQHQHHYDSYHRPSSTRTARHEAVRDDDDDDDVRHVRHKSPSYSPRLNNASPIGTETGVGVYYQTEIVPDVPLLPTKTPFKSKKKSSRKTHFTNKRKKKGSVYPSNESAALVRQTGDSSSFYHHSNHNHNQYHSQHPQGGQYPHEYQTLSQHSYYSSSTRNHPHIHHGYGVLGTNSPGPLDEHLHNDSVSVGPHSVSLRYGECSDASPSLTGALDRINSRGNDDNFDDSDDDRTEPMQESSTELIEMLEVIEHQHPSGFSGSKEVVGTRSSSPPALQHQTMMLNNKQGSHHDSVPAPSSQGSIRMKIKIRKNPNSTGTRGGASSIVHSNNTDLSSPVQSTQHSDDKNSISERLQLMQYLSPLSETEPVESCLPQRGRHSPPPHRSPDTAGSRSPAYSSTQESFRDLYRSDYNSNTAKPVSNVPRTFSKPPTPNKLVLKPSNSSRRLHSSSTHSSPKTLPALEDDCDNKIPTLLFKTAKSAKKRKRSRLSSGSKKVKSKKSVKLKSNHEESIATKPIEKHFISVDDVFSDEDDPVNTAARPDLNHTSPAPTVIAASPIISQRPIKHPSPVIVDKSPYRLPIPPIKFSSKSSLKKPSKSKSKSLATTPVNLPLSVKPVEPKLVYNYCCLQGEAFYKSEDGKTVYTCPICNTEDNGSLMLGCDHCEDWYHGLCLGIFIPPPEDQDWFCPRCQQDKLSESISLLAAGKSKSKSRTKKK